MKKLLYVCEADSGGIMEYAIRQSAAIVREGVAVHFCCKPSFPVERLESSVVLEKFVSESSPFWAIGKVQKVWRLSFGQRQNALRVAEIFKNDCFDAVLFACYKEYFAAAWVGPLKRLSKTGAVIGTIAHDPVRDFVVGPLWWHRWSVRLGYSFVRHVFVHDESPMDFGGKRPMGIQVHQIPHGSYEMDEPKIGRVEMRNRLGFTAGLTRIGYGGSCENEQHIIASKGQEVGMCGSQATANTKAKLGACFDKPSSVAFSNSSTIEFARDSENMALRRSVDGALDNGRSILDSSSSEEIVFLAFGQIRDGKNLDLFLRAMTRLPENVKMLVAGRGESGSSRPPEFYQSLAEELGVAHRCRWDIRRIPEEEMGDIFAVSDIVLLTYSAKFRSASGVLNAAVFARKPVLASSGPGALKTAVQKYHLGVFVEPDNLESTLSGARILTRNWNFNTQCAESNAHKQIEDSYYCQMVAESVNSKESQSNSSLYSIPLKPDWERYEHENSWKENARSVINAFRC